MAARQNTPQCRGGHWPPANVVIFVELPTRKRNRLTQYDYSAANAYFITICTNHRKNLFWTNAGAVVNSPEDVPLTPYGDAVGRSIHEIPKRYPMISVEKFVIMPNHVHLLLQINTDPDGRPMAAPTVSTVVNQMKGAATKRIGFSVWQKGFYDHIIRNDLDYQEVWRYIEGNPGKWSEDSLYTPKM